MTGSTGSSPPTLATTPQLSFLRRCCHERVRKVKTKNSAKNSKIHFKNIILLFGVITVDMGCHDHV